MTDGLRDMRAAMAAKAQGRGLLLAEGAACRAFDVMFAIVH